MSIAGRNNSPLRIIPCLGQFSDHCAAIWWPSISRSNKDAWHVLQNKELGSYLAAQSETFGPEVPTLGIRFALHLSGFGEWLARWACSDDIHDPTPGSSVESSDISSPHRSVIEEFVVDPGLKHPLAILVPFDICDGPEVVLREGESDPQRETTVSAETIKDGICIHVMVTL